MFKQWLLILSLILTLISCSKASDPIRIGLNIWPGYELLILSKRLDYFKKENVRLVEFPSATEVLRAFRNGALEGASLTLDEVLLLKQDGIDIKILFIHDFSNGGDVILARPPIKNFNELKGKKIAVEKGALGAFFITRALEKHHMTIDDVIIKPYDIDSHEYVYKNKKVDAVVTFEPIRTNLLKLGANEIFSSKKIPNEIVDVLVIRNDVLLEQPEKAKNLIDGWFQALDFFNRNREEAYEIISERMKLSPSDLNKLYQGLIIPNYKVNKQFLNGAKPELIPVIKNLNRILLDHNLIQESINPKSLLINTGSRNRIQ